MRTRILIAALLACCMSGLACTHIAPRDVSRVEGEVSMPRVWLSARDALVAAHKQTGLEYAVIPGRFEGTVGPYQVGERRSVGRVVSDVERASGTRSRLVNGTLVFEPADTPRADVPADLETYCRAAIEQEKGGQDTENELGDRVAEKLRGYIREMSVDGRSVHIPTLAELVWHDNRSVGYQALAALHRLEGDFSRNEWLGRVSVFELLGDQFDDQPLLWALERHGDGTSGWKMALDVLGRARHPYIFRHTWSSVWYSRPEAVLPALWAMGRSTDDTAGRALRSRLRGPRTNDPTERYLAAISLGRLNIVSRLREQMDHGNPEVRQAVALGFGMCRPTDRVLELLDTMLDDTDPSVRSVACLSLGRLATDESVGRLVDLLNDEDQPVEMHVAALEGLAQAETADAVVAIVSACRSNEALVRARAAELLGRIGGLTALEELPSLLDDDDRWVRGAAASALGTLGNRQGVDAASKVLLDSEAHPDERIAAMIGLGVGRSPRAEPALSTVALDVGQHTRLRRYAVLALVQLANRAGQDTVKRVATYGTDAYMPFALTHVELDTPDETAKFVAQFLATGARSTQAGAATRLMTLGSAWGTRELLEGYNVFDNHARKMHIWGAISSQGPDIIPVLVEASRSKRQRIRRGAALALGGRRDVAAVDALVALTEDPSADTRANAANELGRSGDPKVVPYLIRLAEEDDSMFVVAAATRALRVRDFSGRSDVQELFRRLAGTSRDFGVIDPDRPSVADQPEHSFVLRSWAGSLEDDTFSNITYESTLTYDSHRRRIVMWGSHGRRVDAPQTGQTWFYRAGERSWGRLLDTHEWPNATCITWGLQYDRANQVVLSPLSGRGGHGWVNALRVNMQFSLPWLLDAQRDEWYPVKPALHRGSARGLPGGYDQRHGVAYWWHTRGRIEGYDAYANAWSHLSHTREAPVQRSGRGGVEYDPKTGRYLFAGRQSVWAFDPVEETWTDLEPEGNGLSGGLTVYDSANHVILQFRVSGLSDMEVAVYHIDENRWEHLPQVHPVPQYGSIDIAYDESRNVTVIGPGLRTWATGQLAVQEAWTYRYKPVSDPPAALSQPRDVTVVTRDDGTAELTWRAPRTGTVGAYRIDRGSGERAALVDWAEVAELEPDETTFVDEDLEEGEQVFYRVVATGEDGEQVAFSAPGRTDPPAVRWTDAVVREGGVHLAWQPSPAEDVIGYHVYRATVDEADYWGSVFNPRAVEDRLERITDEPVEAAEFVDPDVEIDGEASEYSWPATYAYEVRPVNALGVEGGRGPATLALPGPPGRVRIVPWLDGRRLVLWQPPRGVGANGHFVMRQDDWNRHFAFRWNAAPIASFGFWDDREFPTADRRRYYIYGVDDMGAVGIPSSGAWSHGFP